MKENHIESKLKEEQLDPLRRICRAQRDPLFISFWQTCMEKSIGTKSSEKFGSLFAKYTEDTWKFQNAFYEFQEFLKDVPFVVALRHWIEGVVKDDLVREKYLKCMKRLLVQDLIPLTLPKGAVVTLSDMRVKGHQEIIENIRCVQDWTHAEKEELVQCYVRFSCDLARYTFDYVPAGYDPDRRLTSSRLISYEVFYSFVQYLSKRDGLISKLLYFGAPSMEETLLLKVKAIDKKKSYIQFSEQSELFPKHLIQDLLLYAKENSNLKGFVFANVRGEQVERAHLNQSFARASEKMPRGVKITPGNLLRFGLESGDAFHKKVL